MSYQHGAVPSGQGAAGRRRRSPEDMDTFQDFIRNKFVFLRRYRNGLSVAATGCLVVSLLLSLLQVGSFLTGVGEGVAWCAERVLPWTLTLFGVVCAWWCIFPPLDPAEYVARLNEGMRFLNVYFDERRLCIMRLHQGAAIQHASPRKASYSPLFNPAQTPPSPASLAPSVPPLNVSAANGDPNSPYYTTAKTPTDACGTPPSFPARPPGDLPGSGRRWPSTPPPSPVSRALPSNPSGYQSHLTQRTRISSAAVHETFAANHPSMYNKPSVLRPE